MCTACACPCVFACKPAPLEWHTQCRDFDLASKKKSDFIISMDLHEDAVIIIDAVGTILMISQVRLWQTASLAEVRHSV